MTDGQKWQIVLRRDSKYEGLFFFGVKSTKIFCRPSCKSKLPLRKNVVFFENAKQAQQAGYRPCKRCRPDLLEYQPIKETAEKVKSLLDSHFTRQKGLAEKIGQIGLTPHRVAAIFKKYYGTTLKKYCARLRLEAAKKKLAHTDSAIVDIAQGVGFQSLSAFYSFFRKNMNVPPSHYRRKKKNGIYQQN
jgi:AraC family transcriptional regulator of adaptative response / methylphosphotriester-DNA alkyltransferase methyltransferase